MKYEKCCGAVIYTLVNGKPQYVLVLSYGGIWGFAKGHVEGDESEKETAVREAKEETGLDIIIQDNFRVSERYNTHVKPRLSKQVIYFLGYFENQKMEKQEEELQDIVMLPYEDAMRLIKKPNKRNILMQANRRVWEIINGTENQ